jgi:dTDP-4-dehydrorhamnose reductase
MQKPLILVTGSKGQLGSELQLLAPAFPQYDFIFADREELMIDDEAAVQSFFAAHRVSWCVNCAAYTAVDKAESETESAMAVNGSAVGYLAAASYSAGAGFIHISTDYVFNGLATEPYLPAHPVDPVNTYGLTKLKGEELAREKHPGSIIIRTSWVYSAFGHNFVKTMLRLMQERESLNVVSDQLGCPTYAADLAAAIMHIISGTVHTPGMYHYSNSGVISWYDFAVKIRDLSGSHCQVHPIPTSQYPTPAKRPAYSVMDTSLIQETWGVRIPAWEESLAICLDKLKA